MKRKISQFEKWFKAQFGSLPEEHRPWSQILSELEKAKCQLYKLEKEYTKAVNIDEQFKAAQYSYMAAEKKFKF